MKRRRVLAALGTAAAGGSAVLGTGAFTSVSADRSVSVQVAGDQNAFLAMRPCDGSPNGAYVDSENGSMQLDLTSDNDAVGGEGVNADATSRFDQVFEIQNQGTQPVGVWLDINPATFDSGTPRIEFYRGNDTGADIVGQGNAKCLDVGESFCIGFIIRTQGLSSGATEEALFASAPGSNGEEMVVNADAEVGCGSGGGGGTTIPSPTNGLAHYWPLDSVGDGTAEDIMDGSDGTVSGASSTTGRVNGSSGASFDGNDDSIDPSPAPGLADKFSITVWLRGKQFDHVQYPLAVSKWQRAQNRDVVLGYHTLNETLYAQFNDETVDNKTTLFGPSPATNTWYFCAFTYDGSTGRFYVNGSKEDQKGGAFNLTDSKFAIGSLGDGSDDENYWNGTLDDVRIYDRTLSDQEVQELYNATR